MKLGISLKNFYTASTREEPFRKRFLTGFTQTGIFFTSGMPSRCVHRARTARTARTALLGTPPPVKVCCIFFQFTQIK